MGKENEKDKINGYTLSRQWFDFVFNTEEMVRPIHTALYFWIVEQNNRLQWKEVFALPTDYSMKAIGIKGRQHYKKALDDLIKWGFVKLISKSQNQHTCNQVALNFKYQANKLLETLNIRQGIKQADLLGTKSNHSKTEEQTYKTIYNVFYDLEIEKSNDENYKNFVKFLFGDVDLGRPFNKLLKMDDQIDYERFLKLKEVSEQSGQKIYDKCRALENSTKKYVSLYLTLNNWLKNVR